MPRVKLNQLTEHEKLKLLKELEQIGINKLKIDLYNSLLYVLPKNLISNKEFLSRYLLLVAILDQQAESESARRTVIEVYKSYGDSFFLNPHTFVNNFDPIMDLAIKTYQPKTRVIRIKKEGITLLRLGGFLLALLSIERRYGNLVTYLKSFRNPQKLLSAILGDIYFRGLLYEKAARMYVGWITHPNLYVDLFDGSISPTSIPMVVNGHVCKVLARTGFLDNVLVEKDRPIVKAEDERRRIEMLVRKYYPQGDYLMIDYGAFYVGINYCKETDPQCDKCPISKICLRNTHVRAY